MRAFARIVVALGLSCGPLAASETAPSLVSHAYFSNAEKKGIGEALLRETPNGVLVKLDLRDLPPGEHAIHIHETGKCEPPFATAGGHFNPVHKHHGFAVPQGPHAGDLPNLYVPENGMVKAEFLARGATLMPGKPNSLAKKDGVALVIHAAGDDYASDPAGNSGDRIACGVVEKPDKATAGVGRQEKR